MSETELTRVSVGEPRVSTADLAEVVTSETARSKLGEWSVTVPSSVQLLSHLRVVGNACESCPDG